MDQGRWDLAFGTSRSTINDMSHGAATIARATQGVSKGGLSQAEVRDEMSALQKWLSGFVLQFDVLDEALRSFAPSKWSANLT